MAKDRYPEIQVALENAVEELDLDGVLYRLTQIAVKKRNEAGSNKAEEEYWQQALEVLQEAEAKLAGA